MMTFKTIFFVRRLHLRFYRQDLFEAGPLWFLNFHYGWLIIVFGRGAYHKRQHLSFWHQKHRGGPEAPKRFFSIAARPGLLAAGLVVAGLVVAWARRRQEDYHGK